MWTKLKFIGSSIFGFIWPVVRGCLVQAAPIAKDIAIAVVKGIAADYTKSKLSNDEKHATAREQIINQLRTQGVTVGTDIAVSTIDLMIKAAVKKMNGEQ